MKKIVLIIIVLFLGGILLVSTNYSQKSEQDSPNNVTQSINEEKSEMPDVG